MNTIHLHNKIVESIDTDKEIVYKFKSMQSGIDFTIILDKTDHRLLTNSDKDGKIRFSKKCSTGFIIDKYDGKTISVRSFLAPDNVPFVKLIDNPYEGEFVRIADLRASNLIYGNYKIINGLIVKSGKTKYNRLQVVSQYSEKQAAIRNVIGANVRLNVQRTTLVQAPAAVYVYGEQKLSDKLPHGHRAFIRNTSNVYILNVDNATI